MHTLLVFIFQSGLEIEAALVVAAIADLLALASVPSVLIRRRGRPLAALSWLLALMTLPFIGFGLWWTFGRTHLERRRRRRERSRIERQLHRAHEVPSSEGDLPATIRRVLPFAIDIEGEQQGVFPPVTVPEVELLDGGERAFDRLRKEIRAARRELLVMYYIWQDDETGRGIRDLLAERARDGVRVLVLVDGVGSRGFERSLAGPLRDAGARVATFLPVRFRPWKPTFNFRNHRKLVVADGALAITGGMNLGNEYEREWRDLNVALSGDVALQLREVFAEDWFFATGEQLPDEVGASEEDCADGDAQAGNDEGGGTERSAEDAAESEDDAACTLIASGPERAGNRTHDAFFLAIAGATQRVWLTSPYFIPNAAILAALRAASQRGADVRVLVPQRSDVLLATLASRSYYETLMSVGVRVFEYVEGVLHTKAMVIDDDLAVIGSANVDVRSFRLNFELVCFVCSEKLNAALAESFDRDLESSVELDAVRLGRVPLRTRLGESLAHLLSPLL